MSQSSQPSHPTLINLPQPPSQPDTPSEMPGTPTSTTTSLSALSTTAIKDGHRGHMHHHGPSSRGHQHNLSTNSLEAERADRISRLTGLSNVSTSRASPAGLPLQQQYYNSSNNSTQHTTPASTGFGLNANPGMTLPGGLTPAYFDAAGQPVAATKMSTVGSASATESVGGRTTTEIGGENYQDDDDDDDNMDDLDPDDAEMDSASGYTGRRRVRRRGMAAGADAMMDDDDFDNDRLDRMSDDGSASLVGFGEGAGSTVSGPIYHRRHLPGQEQRQFGSSSASAMAGGVAAVWGLERSTSGLSEGSRRDILQERREARMVDGVALDGISVPMVASADDDVFVDTTTRGPVPVAHPPLQATTSAIRETQQPHSHQQQQQQARHLGSGLAVAASAMREAAMREAAEHIVRSRLDEGEGRVGRRAMGSPTGREPLGKFYFEDERK